MSYAEGFDEPDPPASAEGFGNVASPKSPSRKRAG
jgi:hypothetical protein